MPSQYPLLNASKIAKVLEELGFSKVSVSGRIKPADYGR